MLTDLKNFDIIIAPEHDNLKGDNVYSSKGAIHYITEAEINNARSYLHDKVKSEKIVAIEIVAKAKISLLNLTFSNS